MKIVLFLVLVVQMCGAFPRELLLSDDELEEYVSLASADNGLVPDHQIIYIEHVTETSTRHVTHDNMMVEDTSSFKFRAFDEDFHVADVTAENDMFTDQTASCNIINSAGVERTEVIPTTCFLRGNVRGHKDSIVAMSTCNGLTASITRLGHTDLYIEPLSDKHAMKRGIQNGIGHIAYKYAQKQQFECEVEDEVKPDTNNNANTKGALPQMNLKVHVVADHLYYAKRGVNSCRCLIATFLATAHRLELLPNLHVTLNGVDIITSQSVLNTGLASGVNLDAIQAWGEAHPQKENWDHVALIVPQYMDVGGRAWLCGVCGSVKYSVSYCASFNGVQILAHEIGHNLCMNHNSDTVGCMGGGFTMGYASYGGYEQGWADCSVTEFKARAVNKECLTDNV